MPQLKVTRPATHTFADAATWWALTAVLARIPDLRYTVVAHGEDTELLLPGMLLLDYAGVRAIVSDEQEKPRNTARDNGRLHGADWCYHLPEHADRLARQLELLLPRRVARAGSMGALHPALTVTDAAFLQVGVKVRSMLDRPTLGSSRTGTQP